MGDTHLRSNLIEHSSGLRIKYTNATLTTATITTLTGGTMSTSGTVTGTGGVVAGSGKYFKLGSIYIITGAPATFNNAGLDAIATAAAGVSLATSVPRGSVFVNASVNVATGQLLYVKVAPATWTTITNGSNLG
jgi:hypothetical protein